MSAVVAVQWLLSNDAAVTALVGDRIYTGAVQQGAQKPIVLLSKIDSMPLPEIAQRGIAIDRTTRVQVTALGRTYAQCAAILKAVHDALHTAAGVFDGVKVRVITWDSDGPDPFDSTVDEFEQTADYLVTHF